MAHKSKIKYYSIYPILKRNADYNIIYGERSNGKSYSAKDFAIQHFIETGQRFILLRRYDRDITKTLVDVYLSDSSAPKYFGETYGLCNDSGNIYVKDFADNAAPKKHIGYVRSLAQAQRYSSGAYLDCDVIIFEEFISLKGDYLPNEFTLFMHFVSTVARRRNIKVILIGNSISRMCPYFREFQLTHIENQRQGTIDIYEVDNGGDKPTTIAVEYAESTIDKPSRMFFGDTAEMTNGGKWLTRTMPHLPTPRDEWECPYLFVLDYHGHMFLVEYLINDKGQYGLYVTPKSTPIQEHTRVVSIDNSTNPLYTKGFVPLSKGEKKVFDMLLIGKVFYCDNLTGTEFNEVYRRFHTIERG